jgi:hypothetical protein
VNTTWFSENEIVFNNPIPLQFTYEDPESGKDIAYTFANDTLNDYYVGGYPNPREFTAWLPADNTWHPIVDGGQELLYCGEGVISYTLEDIGYGDNWNAELMTRPLYVPGDYKVYLEFFQNISFDFEPQSLGFPWPAYPWDDDQDKGFVSISIDYGNSWIPLGLEYFYDSPDEYVKFDISSYSEQVVMIKFTFDSNAELGLGLPGEGWRVYGISIGYDKNTDFVAPTIDFISPIDLATISSTVSVEVKLLDNRLIDEARINAYLVDSLGFDQHIDRALLNFNAQTGILTFNLDTSLYTDAVYNLKIVVFDEQGNRAESSITVVIENGFLDFNKWWPWLLLILLVVILALGLYIFQEKKGKYYIQSRKTSKIEKLRIKEIDFQQAKKRIELITLEEELKRPNTLHCKGCGSWFFSDKFDIMCPICDRDQIYAAYNCQSCNKWYHFDSPGEENYCPKCSPVEVVESERRIGKKKKEVNKRLGIRLIRREIEDVEEVLAKKGKFLREFNLERRERKYSILD